MLERIVSGVSVLILLAQTGAAPPPRAAAQFTQARDLYYAPVRQGLLSFHCDVVVDWTAFFKGTATLSGHDPNEITPDHPLVKYFASGHVVVEDSPASAARVAMTGLLAPPPELPAGVSQQMANATETAARLFFDFWNPVVNGTLFDPSLPGVAVTGSNDGFRVTQNTSGAPVTDEIFNQQLLLTGFHARIDGYDSPVKPDFEKTAHGWRVQALHIAFNNPVSKTTNDVTMKTTYAPVSGFDLPATFTTSVDGTEFFQAALNNCTVQTKTPLNSPR